MSGAVVRPIVEEMFDGVRLRYVILAAAIVLGAVVAVIVVLDRRFGSVRRAPFAARLALAAVLVAVAAVWVLLNQRVEGRVVVALTADRGVTVADLPALVVALPVLYLLAPRASPRERRRIDATVGMQPRGQPRSKEAHE